MVMEAPWGHQQSASDWLAHRLYGYLQHEVGCGKSRSTLMAVTGKRLCLVVCPIAVGNAWVKQVRLFDPSRRVVVAVDGPSAQRAKKIREALAEDGPLLVVVNYDSVYRGEVASVVERTKWDAIVLDEAHRIKSPSARSTRWLVRLAARHPNAQRICLSGTPTPNNPLDWFGQFLFLDPGVLGKSFAAYRSRLAIVHPRFPGWVTGFKEEALAALTRRINEHVHRVTAEEVLSLPDAIHQTIDVTLGEGTRRFYDGLESEMIARLVDDDRPVTAANKMVLVGSLQLAASGYAKADGEETFSAIDGTPDKLLAFRAWLEDFPKHEPLVVFVKYLEDLRAVCEECRSGGRTCSVLCGDRKELEGWQRGDSDVIVVQQRAGGCGVDLTRACYCVYYSLSHSLGDYEQSLGRLRRPGQKKCVRYYHLVASDTVDEDIYEALRDKREVCDSVFSNLTKRVVA